jgi:hypothetical protein
MSIFPAHFDVRHVGSQWLGILFFVSGTFSLGRDRDEVPGNLTAKCAGNRDSDLAEGRWRGRNFHYLGKVLPGIQFYSGHEVIEVQWCPEV